MARTPKRKANRGTIPAKSRNEQLRPAPLATQASEAEDRVTVTLRVEHVIPDHVDLTYSDNFIVQHTASEFTILFSQIEQPIAATDEEYAQLETVKAKVVARIVIALPKMREFIQALITNWKINQDQALKRLETLNVQVPQHIKEQQQAFTLDDKPE